MRMEPCAADRRTPVCPDCRKALSFVASWDVRDVWGFKEVRTYECSEHGPIFVGPQTPVASRRDKVPEEASGDSDRDSLVSAPRRPKPPLNTDAIAVPEPDSD